MKAKLLVPLLLLLAACTYNETMTDEQKAMVKEEGSKAVKAFFDAMTVNNVEAMKGTFENSADFNYIAAGEVYNYDKMIDMVDQVTQLIESQTFETKFEHYVIVDPNCFVYTWYGKNGMYMTSGEEMIMEDYLVTYCFRKHEEGWKLFAGHESAKISIPVDLITAE
jgi:hypothetical protein